MFKLSLTIVSVLFSVNSFASISCKLSSGAEGTLKSIFYSAKVEGTYAERKAILNNLFQNTFPAGEVIELVPGSIAYAGQTANVCSSKKIGPNLFAALLNKAGFQVLQDPEFVDVTQ